MSEIPESLKWIAIAAIRDGREGCERANRCKCEVGLGECDAKVAAIAYAIMEERERCAQVAENCGYTWSGTRDAMQAAQEAAADQKCAEIAAAIRGQP